jgi:hypothetical protein
MAVIAPTANAPRSRPEVRQIMTALDTANLP